MQSDAPNLRQALLKSHETRSAVAAILERLPDLQGLEVRAESGAAVPFSAERLGASVARAMKEAGEHDEAALAYVTYRVFAGLQPLAGQAPVAPSALADSASSALLAAGLHASLDAYLRRELPQPESAKRGLAFDVAIAAADARPLDEEQQRAVASLTQWAKADRFFAGDADLSRFASALGALLSSGAVRWDESTWVRLVGAAVPPAAAAPMPRVISVPPEFVHALGEGRPGMLLERIVSAVAEGGAALQFDGADKRWNAIPYVWQPSRLAADLQPASFAAVDLAALLAAFPDGLAVLPAAAETLLAAQDIMLSRMPYRDLVARRHAEEFRPVAIGLVGIEAFLAHYDARPDSDEAPALCGALAAVLSGSLHAASARMAAAHGAVACWKLNERPSLRVVGLRRDQAIALPREGAAAALAETARVLWEAAFASAVTHGLRHSQLAALMPERAAARLSGGQPAEGVRIDNLAASPQLALMAAVQPFVSGPAGAHARVAARSRDIGDAVLQAARGGLVSVRLLPETPAVAQQIAVSVPDEKPEMPLGPPATATASPAPAASSEKAAVIHAFSVGGVMATLIVTLGQQGRPVAFALSLHKPGSTAHGLCAVFSEAVSLALAAGVPLQQLAERFVDVGFAPYGPTDNPDIATAASVADYAFRWLTRRFPEA